MEGWWCMSRYCRAAILGICRGSRALRSREGALHFAPGAWEGQPEACESLVHVHPHCSAMQGPCVFTLLYSHWQEHVVLTHRHLVLPVISNATGCGPTNTGLWLHLRGSSIGWGGRGKGTQGKPVGSESRQRVHPLQKTGRSQSWLFPVSQPVSHTAHCVIPLRYHTLEIQAGLSQMENEAWTNLIVSSFFRHL